MRLMYLIGQFLNKLLPTVKKGGIFHLKSLQPLVGHGRRGSIMGLLPEINRNGRYKKGGLLYAMGRRPPAQRCDLRQPQQIER